MRIAFHAPLKGPDHPVPSGDRQMARLLIAALTAAGHAVEVVPAPRTFLAHPDAARQAEVERQAEAAAQATAEAWCGPGAGPPDLWFTYHPFYKAPDFLGPRLARCFGLPYATAEASNAPKRAAGPWASWHAATEAALRAADVHFCFTDQDRAGLKRLLGAPDRILDLPPFIDASAFVHPSGRPDTGTVHLVAVAMMRQGDKLRSFVFLAEALARLPADSAWRLSIVGDGPARGEVEAAFAPLGARKVSWLGQCDPAAIGTLLRGADLYVWPGFNEAYGVGYLEAGAAGLPVLALRCGGIPSVVKHGETGLLVADDDTAAYAEALAGLIAEGALRRRLGASAHAFVTEERNVFRAARILDEGLRAARSSPNHGFQRPPAFGGSRAEPWKMSSH